MTDEFGSWLNFCIEDPLMKQFSILFSNFFDTLRFFIFLLLSPFKILNIDSFRISFRLSSPVKSAQYWYVETSGRNGTHPYNTFGNLDR